MAQQYDNTNRGSLFGNTRKRQGKKDPDLQGKIDVEGTEYWLSAWFFNYEKDGEKRKGISLALGDPVEDQDDSGAERANKKISQMDDDIPF